MKNNKNKAENKSEVKVKPIKYDSLSKLEKIFKASDSEIIAKAVRDLLIRDKE